MVRINAGKMHQTTKGAPSWGEGFCHATQYVPPTLNYKRLKGQLGIAPLALETWGLGFWVWGLGTLLEPWRHRLIKTAWPGKTACLRGAQIVDLC